MTSYPSQPLPAPPGGRAATENHAQPLHRAEPWTGVGPVSHRSQRPARPEPQRYPLVSQLAPLGALPTAPGCARGHIKDTLRKWELSAFEEVGELLISEMVTNAVEASTDEQGHPIYVNGRLPVVIVRLVATGVGLVLEVWDSMPTLPVVKNVDAMAERGRGLQLVETLSTRWAWRTTPDWPGKCVWAELRQPLPLA